MLKTVCLSGGLILALNGNWLPEMSSIRAEEIPTTGLLYNTKETHSLVYGCQLSNDNFLNCEFIQTSVRKKARPEDLNSKLNEAREYFRKGEKISAEDCAMYKDLVDVLENRKKAPNEEGFKEFTDQQKKDYIKTGKGMLEICKSRTEKNFLNVVRLDHEKNSRTCQVSAKKFKQTFRFIQDNISDIGAWVVQGTPEGPCGIVHLSRFEPDRMEDSKLVLWKYVARKAVTNPSGSFLPGASCKGFDEREYIYDWKSKEHYLGCDYIEFSPL